MVSLNIKIILLLLEYMLKLYKTPKLNDNLFVIMLFFYLLESEREYFLSNDEIS